MNSILEIGIDQILWLQSHASPGLDTFFHHFTQFGGRHYLFMAPLVIWCVDFRTGSRVLMWMAFTLFLNSVLKDFIAQPRPFEFDSRVHSDGELGYGLPSGHAQLVVLFWGLLANWVGRRWFWALSSAIMLVMALSRVYLGVHFPTDVLAGLALGGMTLWIAIRYGAGFETWLASLGGRGRMGVLLAASFFVILVNSASFESGLMIGCAGFVLGSGIGIGLSVASGRNPDLQFAGRGPAWQRVARYLVGIAMLLIVVRVGTRIVQSSAEGLLSDLLLYALLALLGIGLTAGGPWLFGVLRLSDARSHSTPE